MYPVTETGIDIWDFNRCLGILLDNAIEASADIQNPAIEFILISHDGFLTVRVANSWKGDTDIGKIWNEGYSTKGEHRGIGLASYQRILEKYPQAIPVTSWTEDLFVQELTIGV
nr:GHKL domain-containing protein [Ruminococcus sp. OA3]